MFGSRPRSLHVPHAALAISDAGAKVRSSVSSWHRHGEAARGTRLSVAARFVAVSSGISTRTAPGMLHATLPLHGWHKEAGMMWIRWIRNDGKVTEGLLLSSFNNHEEIVM